MNARTPNTPATTAPTGARKPAKLRAKTRKAIDLIVLEGKTQRDAAAEAGMNEYALSRALARPEVREYLEEQKALFAGEMEELKGRARVLAIKTGIELMRTSTSDPVKAKMVEFFAGEAKPGVSVNIQNNVNTGGYAYPRPGQEIVEIKGEARPHDCQSGDEGE